VFEPYLSRSCARQGMAKLQRPSTVLEYRTVLVLTVLVLYKESRGGFNG